MYSLKNIIYKTVSCLVFFFLNIYLSANSTYKLENITVPVQTSDTV